MFTTVIGKKLRLNADIYSYVNTGFTNFSAIGDTYALVGSDIPGDLGAAVAADATAYVTGAINCCYNSDLSRSCCSTWASI